MELPITVRERDLFDIADVLSSTDDGMVQITLEEENLGIKRIMLRTVLKCFGGQYHIVSEEDGVIELADGSEQEVVDILTNLPMAIAEKSLN